MVAIQNFISCSLIIIAGCHQAVSQACNEIHFAELGRGETCPEEANYSMPGDCQSYVQCICSAGIMETFVASCSKGELFVDGKCQKESDVQSCPQANCTEKEVYTETQKTFNHSCPQVETTTEPTEEASSTSSEPSAAGSAEKSTLDQQNGAETLIGFAAPLLIALAMFIST